MESSKNQQIQGDFWRFMIINGFFSSIFEVLIRRSVQLERLPLQYYLLSGLGAIVVTAALYFLIRKWPAKRKTWVVVLIGIVWIAAVLWGGKY